VAFFFCVMCRRARSMQCAVATQVAERLQAYRQQQQVQAVRRSAGPSGTPQARPVQQPPQGSPSSQFATMSVDQLRGLQVQLRLRAPLAFTTTSSRIVGPTGCAACLQSDN